MAADINTQLQNISMDVTELANIVNNLSIIFQQGGVNNPDLAVLKAQCQSYTDTKVATCVKLTGNQDVAGTKSFDTIVSNVFKQQHRSFDISKMNTSNIYWNMYFTDVKDELISRILTFDNANASSFAMEFELYPNKIPGTKFTDPVTAGLVVFPLTGESYFRVPTYTQNYSDNSRRVVTTAFLNNINNTVVHKTGNEDVSGTKSFKAIHLDGEVTYKRNNVTLGKKPTSIVYPFGIEVSDTANERLGRLHIGCRTTGTSQMWANVCSTGPTKVSASWSLYAFDGISDSDFGDYGSVFMTHVVAADRAVCPSEKTATLGDAAHLWASIYAKSGTINTSDKRYKTDIEDVPEAVLRAWGKVNFKQFRMKESVESKGNNARLHIGVIANEDADSIMKAFASEGIDPAKYGLFCYDSWKETTRTDIVEVSPAVYEDKEVVVPATYSTRINPDTGEEEQVVEQEEQRYTETVLVKEAVTKEVKTVIPAGERYSVRYEECLALECAYQRWQLKLIKQKLGM